MAPKKPVKRSGASTGGKVVSRVNESDSKNKKVPVTSVTPRATTAKASQKTMTGARKVVGAAAAATPVGRGVKVASSAVKSARATAANRRGLQAANAPGRASANTAQVAKDNAEVRKLVNEMKRQKERGYTGTTYASTKAMYAEAARIVSRRNSSSLKGYVKGQGVPKLFKD
jgi:hypothetical protein